MKKNLARTVPTLIRGAMLGLMAVASLSTASRAETGSIRVVFAKVGFIVGAGGGRGVLTFRGHNYPFRVSGMSLGITAGGSMNKFIGQALNSMPPATSRVPIAPSALAELWQPAPAVCNCKMIRE